MQRVFTSEDQLSFAALSGDCNPIHVDPIAARRLMFGRQVVHGIHAVLWAIDRFLADNSTPQRIRTLSVEFLSPMLVDDQIKLNIISGRAGANRIELSNSGNISATIDISLDPANDADAIGLHTTLPEHSVCREVSPIDIKNKTGRLPLHLSPEAASALFPALTRLLVPSQLAGLLATTRLVGMELPGLHSLYTGFDLSWSDEIKEPVLEYAAERSDQQSAMLLILAVKSPGFSGKLSAAFRPAPAKQAEFAEIRRLVQSNEFRGERALVIGGSRGLGEVAVKALAAGGADVRFTFFKGANDAERIAADIRNSGVSVSSFAFDVQTDAAKLPELLADWRPTLLCYFATPTISSTSPNQFQTDRFSGFCRVYVDAFLNTFNAVSSDLRGVLYPSSSAIDELPSNMGEYAAAKAAAENLCSFLAKTHRDIKFHTPRYSRLATDQTATVVAVETGDAKAVVLQSLRHLRGEIPAVIEEAKPVTGGFAFAIAATFTSEPIERFLRFWMSELGQSGPVEFAPYNQIFQTLLDPAGLMSKKNFANAVLIRLEDWIEGDKSAMEPAEWKARLQPLIAELVSAARAIPRPAPVLVVVCPPSTKVVANSGVLDELTTELVEAMKGVPGVYAFAPPAVASMYPVADYYNATTDAVGKIPYTPKYFAALGTFLARTALAVRRLPFKAIVLDCDNTLWSGVCGEGGVSAVTVGPGFRAMQEFMAAQSAQGKVICLCSKNAESDVWDIFDNHPDMVLKRGQIVAHRINWKTKGENLRELAKELNVGLDSFIFLDDNPVECAEVRASCPQVLTLQVPARGDDWPDFLKHVWAFDQLKVTDQDRQRAASYQQNARRESIRKESAGLDDFLAKLDLRVEISPVTAAKMERVVQLTERTNQFNFSTIRRSEGEIVALLKDSQYACDTVEVKDRFGDYGLVGVMITRVQANALVLDTMLLSCRVLGRGVEHRMLASIGTRAKSLGLAEVQIPFVRSAKNQPALDFLNGVARDYRSETGDGFVYRIPADAAAASKAKVISAPPAEGEKENSVEATATTTIPYQQIAEKFSNVDAILAAVDPVQVSLDGAAPLRTIVAELLGIAPEQLGSDRVLSGARLPGSLGRAILDAALRRRLGVECAACYFVKTFGELEAAVNAIPAKTPSNSVPSDQAGWTLQTSASSVESRPPVAAQAATPLTYGGQSMACGVDMELIDSLPATTDYQAHEFYTTNFTPAEIAYCVAQQSPPQHFAARWSAKEALKKCEPSLMGEQMRNIEVVSHTDGAPSLRHHTNGSPINLPHALSLSHTSLAAVAMVARSGVAAAPVAHAPPQAGAPVSWLSRLKQKFIRRISYEVTEDAEAKRRSAIEAQINLHPSVVILPEATIENLSGKKDALTIGENSTIRGRLMVFPHAGSISIGSWCYVGARTEIWSMASVKIGDRVQIAHNVTMLDSSSHSRNAAERHAQFRAIVTTGHPPTWADLPGITAAPIVIEEDVWIGAGVIVLPGVRIGARAIVAAGAIVNVDVPADTIYSNEVKAVTIPNYA